MPRKRKYDAEQIKCVPVSKKRRVSPSKLDKNDCDDNIYIELQSQHSSEFSCIESSQFSCFDSSNSQNSQFSSQRSHESTESESINRCYENIAAVLLQQILSFNTPFELSLCSVINKFYNNQCKIMWQRMNECTISPALFPSLIDDDYDSQFEYNPSRHPHRTHFTLNWIIGKLNVCSNLQRLKIERTMMNGQMFQSLIKNCPNLLSLHLDENPWIFLLGITSENDANNDNLMDTDNMEMYVANLFDNNSNLPSFKLKSFVIESMYMNITDITFNRLLSSSSLSLRSLILKKRDPFNCSYCDKASLCKWHKCEDCELRSYCSRKCQSDDWWQHQYVCSYHDPNGVLKTLQSDNRLNGGFLDTICSFKNLITLDLTWCYIVHHTALNVISLNCSKLQNIILNGCDVSDEGIISLATNLKSIKLLHCRAARYVTDRSLEVLSKQQCETLIDLDISRCCLISKDGCLNLINHCLKLESLGMACAIKRGGWIWTIDNQIVKAILNNLKYLKKLQYVGCSKKYHKKLLNIKDIEIHRISTEIQTQLRNINGHLRVVFLNVTSIHTNPVLMEHFINGSLVYSHRFRR